MTRLIELTAEGARTVDELATRHSVSVEAVTTLTHALIRGGGRQAQFDHPELGGMGQWSFGGMTMVGDMFNTWMKAKVDALCQELSGCLAHMQFFKSEAHPPERQGQTQTQGSGVGGVSHAFGPSVGGSAWPAELGAPASTGSQNDLRYAVFPESRRLAISHSGGITLYDTADHTITGVSQQQGGGQTLTFTSQYGLVRLDDLLLIDSSVDFSAAQSTFLENAACPSVSDGDQHANMSATAQRAAAALGSDPRAEQSSAKPLTPEERSQDGGPSAKSFEAVFAALERLSELHKRGVVTDEEFSLKKADLLSRI